MNDTVTSPQMRVYTRNEQNESLKAIVEMAHYLGERPLARLVWQYANTNPLTDRYMNDSFQRDAASLHGVPLATIYNRIRRLRGKIK